MTVREHMALAVEQHWWRHPGAKEAHTREHLGMSAVRHAQVVAALVGRADVEREYPGLVRRLRRVREVRRRGRVG